MSRKIKELIQDYLNAQRMLNFAETEKDIESAIMIMHLSDKMLGEYRKINKIYLNDLEDNDGI